jgi:hypothetical protein
MLRTLRTSGGQNQARSRGHLTTYTARAHQGRSQFFPIAVKLNPLNQFGRIGRADEVFAHE